MPREAPISVSTIASWRCASSAISESSSRLKTLPVGLCGEFTMTARVRSLNAARSSDLGEHDRVMALRELGDQRELLAAEDLAGRVVRSVHDDRPGAVAECRAKLRSR